MELALFVYLVGVVGSLGALFTTLTIIGLIALIIYIIIILLKLDDDYQRKFSEFSTSLRNTALAVAAVSLLSIAAPSEKTMYLMLAGYTSQQVLQSEQGNKVAKIIDAKLDEYLKEITKEKK